jgi:hypothetical protein
MKGFEHFRNIRKPLHGIIEKTAIFILATAITSSLKMQLLFFYSSVGETCEDLMGMFFKHMYFHIDIQESCDSICSRFSTCRLFLNFMSYNYLMRI